MLLYFTRGSDHQQEASHSPVTGPKRLARVRLWNTGLDLAARSNGRSGKGALRAEADRAGCSRGEWRWERTSWQQGLEVSWEAVSSQSHLLGADAAASPTALLCYMWCNFYVMYVINIYIYAAMCGASSQALPTVWSTWHPCPHLFPWQPCQATPPFSRGRNWDSGRASH